MLRHSPILSDRALLKPGQSDHTDGRIQLEESVTSTVAITNSGSYLTGTSWPTYRRISLSNSSGI